jgi:hypothetical protein
VVDVYKARSTGARDKARGRSLSRSQGTSMRRSKR